MASLLQQLQGDESILLMYLADELPAEDRAQVERRLAGEAGLRDRLRQMQSLHQEVSTGLASLDALNSSRLAQGSSAAEAAVRQVSRAITRWHVNGPPRSAVVRRPGRNIHLPRWAYPTAAAAAILIGWIAWWGFQPNPAA